MRELKECLGLPPGCRVALVGSGGKTSLLFYLAGQYAAGTVLVSTTTKIGWPPPERYQHFIEAEALGKARPLPGVSLCASRSGEGKLAAPPPEALRQAAAAYDAVFLESDGSRQLPLKGWAAHEPVVPPWVSHTVGLLPLWPLGRPASEALVHRWPLFSALAGVQPGALLQPQHLARAIAGQGGKGLFSAAVGRRVLFFSQVESEEARRQAHEVLALLPQAFRHSLWRVVAGSVHQNSGEVLAETE